MVGIRQFEILNQHSSSLARLQRQNFASYFLHLHVKKGRKKERKNINFLTFFKKVFTLLSNYYLKRA